MFSAPPIALYIHIPFCETKCPYCDFNTYARIEPLMPGYVAALIREIELWGDLLEHPTVRTVFFGGGTPSYLPSEDISQIMQTANRSFKIEEGAEVTLEANPGDFTPDKLTTYLESGINRLSIGVQT
ncbi:MAG: radical SAM protein, partial [SAR202 cluster bacterium]|nr:radical SAM protein [SAR202 cluster bacterium]